MTAQEAWAYLKPLLKHDAWGQDGAYDTDQKLDAIMVIDEVIFRLEGTEF